MTDTLYVLGNGFDLHHGLETSYLNFRDDYVKKRNPQMWNNLLDIYGDAPKQDDFWWKDFENMLGNVDYAHLEEDYYRLAHAPSRVQNLLKNKLPPLFGYWINGIDTNVEMDESLGVNRESMFFTFNYTLIIEETYKVPDNHIWHIHGSVINSDDIVVGHDSNDRTIFSKWIEYKDKNENGIIRNDVIDNINRETADGAKKVKERIEEYQDKFYNLYSCIKHIVVMGFSFNDIDIPYIKKIISVNKNTSDVDWTIYWHTKGEDAVIKQQLLKIGIRENISFKEW